MLTKNAWSFSPLAAVVERAVQYRRRRGVAKLVRVVIICRSCHQIHHWGLTTKLVAMGNMEADRLDELMEHFCKINDCKPKDFRRHMYEAQAVWTRRSELEWTVDWGPYAADVQLACEARDSRKAL